MCHLIDKAPHLCSRCRSINISAYFDDETYPGTVELGPYQEILSNVDCMFCMLIIHALKIHSTSDWKQGVYPVELCYLGRKPDSPSPILDVWFDCTTETLPSSHVGHNTIRGQIMPMYSPTHCNSQRSGQTVGSQINFKSVRSWIDDCIQNHGSDPNPSEDQILPRDELGILLIDIEHMRLVRARTSFSYVALSYVWGETKKLLTTKANLQALEQEGSIADHREVLPRVINDTIDLARELGQRYLWVDGLCIVQDDNAFKREHIPRMGQIFGQALFTIIALAGSHSDTGLPGVIPGSRTSPQKVMSLGPLQLVTGLPSLFHAKEMSKWNTRAWTLQEEVFSHRALYVSKHQVYWNCHQCYRAEDFVNFHWRDISTSQMVPDDATDRFIVYQSVVRRYSPRELTYHSDSLNAILGILTDQARRFSWKFASALPETTFPRALLWSPVMSLLERRPTASYIDDIRPTASVSPSWCWTAWSGDIFWDGWRHWGYAGKDINLQAEVQSFTIKDSDGFREIAPSEGFACAPLTTGNQGNSHWAMTFDTGYLPRATLFFEAHTLCFESFALLTPQPTNNIGLKRLPIFLDKITTSCVWIRNGSGHHCGILYGLSEKSWSQHNCLQCELVLLARGDQDEITNADIVAWKDHLPLEYPSSSQYYDEVFDAVCYGYKRWWALHVMLIEWKGTHAERVAVGLMHHDAWDIERQEFKRIILA